MRRFLTQTVDSKTGCRMILSECSYNFACDYLMQAGFTDYDYFDSSCGLVTMRFSDPQPITFIYDEARGYLMAEEV